MKTNLRIFCLLCLSILFGCNIEQLKEDSIEQDYFKVTEFTVTESNLNRENQGIDYCFNVDLIAGQHNFVGTLGVTRSETDLILTYSTIPNWTIGVTHVSIGDCNEEWVPTTGSGNPKIGKFGHTEPHSVDINKVVYHISLDVLPEDSDLFCFAAHAEVNGPDGEETAWAGGDNDGGGGIGRNASNPWYTVKEFEGRSWATYIEALLSSCSF